MSYPIIPQGKFNSSELKALEMLIRKFEESSYREEDGKDVESEYPNFVQIVESLDKNRDIYWGRD